MITCTFEKGYTASLRHIVTHAIVEKSGTLLLVKRAGNIPEAGKWALPGILPARLTNSNVQLFSTIAWVTI